MFLTKYFIVSTMDGAPPIDVLRLMFPGTVDADLLALTPDQVLTLVQVHILTLVHRGVFRIYLRGGQNFFFMSSHSRFKTTPFLPPSKLIFADRGGLVNVPSKNFYFSPFTKEK